LQFTGYNYPFFQILQPSTTDKSGATVEP